MGDATVFCAAQQIILPAIEQRNQNNLHWDTRSLNMRLAFSAEARSMLGVHPLLAQAIAGDLGALRAALDSEARTEQAIDRAYWEPLRKELEGFRQEERKEHP